VDTADDGNGGVVLVFVSASVSGMTFNRSVDQRLNCFIGDVVAPLNRCQV
jgi:hypothetical protein